MISILETSGEKAHEITTFLLDEPDDLQQIPKKQIGDMVYIVSTGEWKILSSQNEWKLFITDFNFDEF